MLNKINFTKTALNALPLPESGKRVNYFDLLCPGLMIQISSTGNKSFYSYRWVNGKPEKLFLGRFPAMTIENARNRAGVVNSEISQGNNPKLFPRQSAEKEATSWQPSVMSIRYCRV